MCLTSNFIFILLSSVDEEPQDVYEYLPEADDD